MINRKEVTAILITTLILGFAITLMKSLEIFLYACLSVFLIIFINTTAKKISGFYLDSEIEVGLWEIKRAGLSHFFNILPVASSHPAGKLKRPFPAGAFFPLVSKIFLFPFNNFVWMASLVFDVKPKVYRAAKRYGLYKFSEMTEYHIGLIAASGIAANILFAVIGYLVNFSTFAELNIYYALFNLIPLSELDGNKIFFGSFILWSFLTSIVLLGMLCIIFIV